VARSPVLVWACPVAAGEAGRLLAAARADQEAPAAVEAQALAVLTQVCGAVAEVLGAGAQAEEPDRVAAVAGRVSV
jgi:hypothetical protein